jgi:predicted acetyltransferase
MSLQLRWADEKDLDRVAEARLRCYAASPAEFTKYRDNIYSGRRAVIGDHLLAERDGQAVGTATSLSLTMWARGTAFPAQGVADVGTIKTARRGGKSNERGIASQVMHEVLRKARERGQVVSALMPFRASFYEHFGYGLAERRTEWVVPLSVLPHGDFSGFRYATPEDDQKLVGARQRLAERGQCDFERTLDTWRFHREKFWNGFEMVDQAAPGGPIESYLHLQEIRRDEKTMIRVVDRGADSFEAFLRQLHFLASLRDQYSSVVLYLPGNFELNRLLKEVQIPHRIVEHPTARAFPFTRMQIRVLDHKRFLEGLHLPKDVKGRATIAIAETEGEVNTLRIELSDGRMTVTKSTDSPDIEARDVHWASIASGDASATNLARLNLIRVHSDSALAVLDALSVGPVPFSNEHF